MQSVAVTDYLDGVVARQKAGVPAGLWSLCSANRYVIEAGMLQAERDEGCLLIESTSNQVNQFGGYTGMQPAEFRNYVWRVAADMNFPVERIILGGDHLGPNAWTGEPAEVAMHKGCNLISACVQAGYTKIHIDASTACADDSVSAVSWDEVVAERAAALCRSAEEAARSSGVSVMPRYVIGTEVPSPGGAKETLESVPPTRPDAAMRTIELNRAAFERCGLESAWERVMAVVVQPGVEFGNHSVVAYHRATAADLAGLIKQYDHLVYEAHSTDYQSRAALREMVEDHFAVLKVGPWLTFALREALFALSFMETELLEARADVRLSNFAAVLEQAMIDDPAHWKQHYHGTPAELAVDRRYGFSDRARYYLPVRTVSESIDRLMQNLKRNPPPPGMLSQYMPNQYAAVCSGQLHADPADLVRHHIMEITGHYSYACGNTGTDVP